MNNEIDFDALTGKLLAYRTNAPQLLEDRSGDWVFEPDGTENIDVFHSIEQITNIDFGVVYTPGYGFNCGIEVQGEGPAKSEIQARLDHSSEIRVWLEDMLTLAKYFEAANAAEKALNETLHMAAAQQAGKAVADD
ncbi:hypothetical protein [Bifidobacterium subtile]|jgi:hypothetical protein|uniref:hypothetical protein n=1 Tax=Bifidobacterium subtile TaxID=77635 RepID=UPI002F350DAC